MREPPVFPSLPKEPGQNASSQLRAWQTLPRQSPREISANEHFVFFYSADRELIGSLSDYIVAGLKSGESSLVIATRSHRVALDKRLQEAGYDLEELKESGAFSAFDAAEVLGLFMKNGKPDEMRFIALVGGLLKSISRGNAPVRAFGEMVGVLWDEGNRKAAVELEKLWNELAKSYSFTLCCAYRKDQFSEATIEELKGVCKEHSKVLVS